MTILLINDNPVVSRLLSLCTRDDEMVLESISNINDASAARYDVLFVDEASCEGDVASLSTRLDVGKKIYLSYSGDAMAGFDETIKKPFLPSQVIAILKNVEVREPLDDILTEEISTDVSEVEELRYQDEVPSIFPLASEEVEKEDQTEEDTPAGDVLNLDEIEKIKALLDMDEEEPEVLDMDEETYESRKIEVIKEQLISDGLEIFEEEEIVDELSKEKKPKKKKKKKKNEKFTKQEHSEIEEALENAINQLKPKKMQNFLQGKEIKVKVALKGKN